MMDAPPPPQKNVLAWLALVLGILAPLTCGATAPFAIVFGFLALRRINLSDGSLPGARLARVGAILGLLGIVVLLGGLFIIGLNRYREKSDLTVCTNNLRRIGQAVIQYREHQKGHTYPRGTIPNLDLPADERLSWMVSILPFMETDSTGGANPDQAPMAFRQGGDLLGRFDLTQGWKAEQNRQALIGAPSWFICPAATHRSGSVEVGWTQYVGIGGYGPDSPTLPKTDPRAGFFGYDRIISAVDLNYDNPDDKKQGRGEIGTMIVTERAGALGPWSAGGPPTVTGIDPEKQPYVPRQFGGLHPMGANTLFADGHVNFISERADPIVWERQCRINVEY
jgi:prepilin-type processing-associated H-X9-DG protein